MRFDCDPNSVTLDPRVKLMRLSRFFLPILKETPKEAEIVSHRLMLRAGMIRQQSAGIYSWLPLGFRVLKNIEQNLQTQHLAGGLITNQPRWQFIGNRLEERHRAIMYSLLPGFTLVSRHPTIKSA